MAQICWVGIPDLFNQNLGFSVPFTCVWSCLLPHWCLCPLHLTPAILAKIRGGLSLARVLCGYEARSQDREVVKRCLSAWGDELESLSHPWVPFMTSVARWSWVISSYLQESSVLYLSLCGRKELPGGFLRGQELFMFGWGQNWWVLRWTVSVTAARWIWCGCVMYTVWVG